MRSVVSSRRVVAFAFALASTPVFGNVGASAHGASCDQMGVALRVMQKEIDELRMSAQRYGAEAIALRRSRKDPSKALAAQSFTDQRVDIEQQRTNGLRHNVEHCTAAPDDDDRSGSAPRER